MPSTLFVTSESNRRFIDDLPFNRDSSEIHIVKEPPSHCYLKTRHVNKLIIAIGGGSVIDTAKLISGRNPCLAIPTTASGSAVTSWAVIWNKNGKSSIRTSVPILCEYYKYMDIKLSKETIKDTYHDCLAHIQDSRDSVNTTAESLDFCSISERYVRRFLRSSRISDLIDAGNYAGRAINITGTNRLHALSYVLTLEYGISHGKALRLIANKSKQFDWKKIEQKSKKFKKYYESNTARENNK